MYDWNEIKKKKKIRKIIMEATPLCLLLHKPHLLNRKQHRFILIQIAPLHVRYMFRPVLGKPSSGMSIQKSYKDIIKSRSPSFTVPIFYNDKTEYTKQKDKP